MRDRNFENQSPRAHISLITTIVNRNSVCLDRAVQQLYAPFTPALLLDAAFRTSFNKSSSDANFASVAQFGGW
ncbi:MAG TPA: hypothetical protein VME45_22740 [Stellaceae bacterium]|nr:hypothetical protein [Stellaceae bacterium]